jgi:hypothetical protein
VLKLCQPSSNELSELGAFDREQIRFLFKPRPHKNTPWRTTVLRPPIRHMQTFANADGMSVYVVAEISASPHTGLDLNQL